MQTWPLKSINIEEAIEKQFLLIDCITQEFSGTELLTRGDMGVVPSLNKPKTTHKTEQVLANFFQAEAALLVRGAGTTAIRSALYESVASNSTLLVHEAPIYPTTQVSLDILSIETIKVNFNDLKELKSILQTNKVDGVLIQLTRQKPDDFYNTEEVINVIKNINQSIPIITDDNYAVMKVSKIGVEMGADLSCFSMFKLLGPEGIGCIVGKEKYIKKLRKENYSGGLQVQGHEAIDVLRGLTYAPVALAISSQTSQEVCDRLNSGELLGVKRASIANAQSKVILIEFTENIAKEVLDKINRFGAAPYPVGAESQYEIVPMFYRVSNTFIQYDNALVDKMIRVNPMRSGPDTILNILKTTLNEIRKN